MALLDALAGKDAPPTPAGPIVRRDATGRFLPGQSGNPGGRPLGFAEQIRAKTGDGEELYEFALGVLRDETHPIEVRVAAMKWLADRGWGKAPETVSIEHAVQQAPAAFDLTRLSADDLRAYLAIRRKARGELPRGGEVVDVTPTESSN